MNEWQAFLEEKGNILQNFELFVKRHKQHHGKKGKYVDLEGQKYAPLADPSSKNSHFRANYLIFQNVH